MDELEKLQAKYNQNGRGARDLYGISGEINGKVAKAQQAKSKTKTNGPIDSDLVARLIKALGE